MLFWARRRTSRCFIVAGLLRPGLRVPRGLGGRPGPPALGTAGRGGCGRGGGRLRPGRGGHHSLRGALGRPGPPGGARGRLWRRCRLLAPLGASPPRRAPAVRRGPEAPDGSGFRHPALRGRRPSLRHGRRPHGHRQHASGAGHARGTGALPRSCLRPRAAHRPRERPRGRGGARPRRRRRPPHWCVELVPGLRTQRRSSGAPSRCGGAAGARGTRTLRLPHMFLRDRSNSCRDALQWRRGAAPLLPLRLPAAVDRPVPRRSGGAHVSRLPGADPVPCAAARGLPVQQPGRKPRARGPQLPPAVRRPPAGR
mmetsp:Transcript_517/g.1756  ORF Transcript_517/g.1756 Transcript_517/m.1756 type:complete len:311 (+) Transcript_517:394-1326(+)